MRFPSYSYKNLFKKNKTIILCFILFFLSRIFFINAGGVFFDSDEYLHLFSLSNFLQAIVMGHAPPHEGYILLFWPIYHLSQFFHANAAYAVILVQIILSFFTLLFFYYSIKYIIDKKTALYTAIIASLIPLFWIINVTLMMENAYVFFFFLSLFLLTKFLTTKKNYILHASLLFYSLALLTQTLIILWAPLYLYIIFLKEKTKLRKVIILLSLYVILFSFLNIFFVASGGNSPPQKTFYYLYLSKSGEFAEIQFNFKGLLISLRNFIIPLLKNNTAFIIILTFVSLIVALLKDKKIFLFGLLFIAPALYTTQWWDSLLNGRHALIASFGIAFLTAYLISRKNIIYFLLIIGYLLFVSLPALSLLNKPIPYIQEAQFAATIPKDGLFIESHFARPQVQATVKSKTIYINEPRWNQQPLANIINVYLKKREPVFISSAALSEPYGLYSGPYLHNITLSYAYPFILDQVLTNYTIVPYKIINKNDNLLIYKITTIKKHPYPTIKNMRNSYRRLDYADPFWQATWWVETTLLHQ